MMFAPRIVFMFFWLTLLTPVFAMPFHGSHHFDSYSLGQGLSQASALEVIQDQQGYIWVGTQDGLNRFDGQHFLQFRHVPLDARSLSSNYIAGLTLDWQQQLWVLTPLGLHQYQPEYNQFTRIDQSHGLPEDPWQLIADASGNLWISSNKGISRYDIALGQFQHFDLPLANRQKNNFPVRDMTLDERGHLHFISQQQKYQWLPQQGQFSRESITLANNDSLQLMRYIGQRWWLATDLGLMQLAKDGATHAFWSWHSLNIEGMVTDLQSDQQGGLWVGSLQGLYRLPLAEHWHTRSNITPQAHDHHSQVEQPYGLLDNSVETLFTDNNKVLWIGTRLGGVSKLSPQALAFQSLSQAQQLLQDNVVMAMLETDQGLWLGTADGSLSLWGHQGEVLHQSTPKFSESLTDKDLKGKPLDGQTIGVVLAIAEDSQNEIWLAGTNGLGRLTQAGQLQSYRITDEDGFSDHYTSQVFLFNGELWAISTALGLAKYLPEQDEFALQPIFLAGENRLQNINNVLVDGDALWLTSFDGELLHYDSQLQQLTKYPLKRQGVNVQLDSITSIYRDPLHRLWLTHQNGLLLYDIKSQRLEALNLRGNMPEGMYYQVLSPSSGSYWVAHSKWLLQLDEQANVVRKYQRNVGLPVSEFNSSSLVLASGELAFGHVGGVLTFHPRGLPRPSASPEVALTSLKVLTTAADQAKQWQEQGTLVAPGVLAQVQLPWHNASLKLSFSQLRYDHQGAEYRYRLKGLESKWNLAEPGQTQASYHQLPPGGYQFEVQVANQSQQWHPAQALLAVTITAPWWQSLWAYLIYLACGISVIVYYFRWRIGTEQAYSKKLAQQVEYRTATIAKMSEQKLRLFANVSHEFRTPLTLIKAPAQYLQSHLGPGAHQQDLGQISRNCDKLLTMLDNLLVMTRVAKLPEAGKGCSLNQLAQRALSHYDELARTKHQQLALEIKGQLGVACSELELETVIFNLLGNAIKYCPAHSDIRIIARTIGHQVVLAVKDNGPGMSAAQLTQIFEPFVRGQCHGATDDGAGLGLTLVKETVVALGGVITVQSELHQGTTFRVCLPSSERVISSPEKPPIPLVNTTDWRARATTAAPGQPQGKVLIVEDNAAMAQYLQQILQGEYQCTLFNAAEPALAYLNKHSVDLVISDYVLPEMDGLAMCRSIKTCTSLCHIPVLFVSAKVDRQSKLAALSAKAADIMAKPFDVDELMIKVANLIQVQSPALVTQDEDSADKEFVVRLAQTVADMYSDPDITISDISDAMFVTSKQLQRKIKALLQITPNEYLRQYRLDQAQALLKQGLSIQQVSQQAGFNSQSYFTNCYKKAFAQTPKQAQQQMRAEEPQLD
ncbi:ATP-binding protein [Motilimonas pumila]|uniref:histidine kinase n=1 Tax=Motilimonas pumila TaxID=2303987 RepID=A0A418YGM4_9GAMM|nr:ATP-binding protein [Motilimonas pumila]RJG48738.1 response regulator [Motilimonas pumila]